MKHQTTNPSQFIIAFDYGIKKIGVAIGQRVTLSAQPLDILFCKDAIPDWQKIAKIVQKWQPAAFVVGIPLNMDGTPQAITAKALAFAAALRVHFALPVYETDERLTTKDAKEQLFANGGYKALQNGAVDKLAAKLILENWMKENNLL